MKKIRRGIQELFRWLACLAVSFGAAAALRWLVGGSFILWTAGATVGGFGLVLAATFLMENRKPASLDRICIKEQAHSHAAHYPGEVYGVWASPEMLAQSAQVK